MAESTPPGMRDVMNPRLTEAEIAALEPHATRRRLQHGEPLFQAGERRGGFYIVLNGGISRG